MQSIWGLYGNMGCRVFKGGYKIRQILGQKSKNFKENYFILGMDKVASSQKLQKSDLQNKHILPDFSFY